MFHFEVRTTNKAILIALLLASVASISGQKLPQDFGLNRGDRSIIVEPYGKNIVRITLSTVKSAAAEAPGYGIIGKVDGSDWQHLTDADGYDVFRSSQMVVRIAPSNLPSARAMPLDSLNQQLRARVFYGYSRGPYNDSIAVTTAKGTPLLKLENWSMYPEESSTAKDYRISATFDAPQDEHYYGLGQQQQGFLDLRNHQVRCWHDYGALGGETVCVPFMVSSKGYGFVWDNTSKTTATLGFNQHTTWSSDSGDRVSFFVIAGENSDDIYSGYRTLTGVTHLLPKAAYGFIQSKAIYPTQGELEAVAKGYRDRNLPLDVLVVDFLNMTRQGEMDLDPQRWPDPAAMNKQLHSQGITTLLSVWPHYAAGTSFYDMLLQKGWLIHKADGTPDSGYYTKEIGPNLDTTNPDAAKWWWDNIRDRYVKPYGFDFIWLDETEPDVDPESDLFYIGTGKRNYNVYPLFHTASVYEGFRRDFGDSRRVMLLARAAYLGAQRNGTVFWSSDVVSTWDMLKRSIPAGLNFTASGMPYWDTDIAGFFSPQIPSGYQPEHPPLIDPSDVRENIDRYTDYPELFVRWFEWGAFQPVMRTHGERMHNEVWSYGKQAQPILEKYLRLRYQLLPYIYSAAYKTYQIGAPFMRALFMDFPSDPAVADIRDEYMFGPAFLVAPVSDQGATTRKVYLPEGTDWYNYWTNERIKGGQTITVSAPIDTLPLFVRAGSILPLGSPVLSTHEKQTIETVKVYSGKNGDFTLFSDDGTTYAYEKDGGKVTKLHWDDATEHLTYPGSQYNSGKVTIIR